MHKEVRNIILTIIGTMMLMVCGSLLVEMLNVSVAGMQMKQMAKIGCKASMDLFSNETYKPSDDGKSGTVNMLSIAGTDGVQYVTGKFYNSTEPIEIYNEIYSLGTNDFTHWIETVGEQGNWEDINLMQRWLKGDFEVTEAPSFQYYLSLYSGDYSKAVDKYAEQMQLYGEYSRARTIIDEMRTPLNIGVPYMEKDVVQKMFRWNISKLYSNCDTANIVLDRNGKRCISSNGFLVYADEATLSEFEYKVFDLSNEADKTKFRDIVDIDPDKLDLGDAYDERNRVCIVTVNYTVPMSYRGITPLKSAVELAWNSGVDGLDSSEKYTDGGTYTEGKENLHGGGFNGSSGALPVPGKLIYCLIR